MKKAFLIFILTLSFFGCDDGDINQSSFEFAEKVNVCGEYTLYRLSENGAREALIVTLTGAQIKNSEEPVAPVNVSVNGPYTVTDRVFADEVTSSYFCQVLPPIEPKVKKDWRGVSGTIFVQNNALYGNDGVTVVGYEHIIVLNDVLLESGNETLVFNDAYLFGTFQSTVSP
ncbi:hypothetical protein [Namhaeicola litoreus]|uniref:Lipocalin-like domain-containing protein n=1 Tax=Namhaeicola litoreus TaxID=1052145 RepID=A0ABW3Y2H1_9FLAO